MAKKRYDKKIETEDSNKFILPFNIDVLDMFCMFTISDNKSIRRSNLLYLRKLFESIHMDSFRNDEEKLKRVDFIKRALQAKLDMKLDNKSMIISYANGSLEDSNIIDISSLLELSNNEVDYVNSTVAACLSDAYFFKQVDEFDNLVAEFKATDYKDRHAIVLKFKEAVKNASTYFRQNNNNNHDEGYLSLNPSVFNDKVYTYYEQLSSPSNKLKCGMQGFNEMINGGFENGRHYTFFGLQGEGKSMLMLNLAIQIKLHNKQYQLKDQTKRPCVVYITQENSERESFERLYNIAVTISDLTESDPENIIRDFMENDICLIDDNNIDLIIKFKAGGTVDTSFLYEVYDDLSDDGYEPICFIHDYIHRIHCSDRSSRKELRLEYGAVVNEEHNFAEEKDIPFITAGQLNRDATNRIDEGRSQNKADLIRLLGRSNIAESMWVLSNTDGAFIIAPEIGSDGFKYLGIQKIKGRFRGSNRNHIYQPYEYTNPIRLMVDEGEAEPKFRDTLRAEGLPANGVVLTQSRIQNRGKEDGGVRVEDDIIMKPPVSKSASVYNQMQSLPKESLNIIPTPKQNTRTTRIPVPEVPVPFKIIV